jgi:drug/metabolite transporter (DMT)-like permease
VEGCIILPPFAMIGEIAALGTAFFWSLTSIQFTQASRRIGSVRTNRIRLVLAVTFLLLTHLLLYGEPWPIQAEPFRWGWLGISGVVGLVLGDASLFQSFIAIGPRRGMLMMTLAPVISALVAWGWLGETLSPVEIAAILLTVGGIAWVVSEGNQGQENSVESRKQYGLGVLFGLGGAIGQALGLVLAKQGLVGDFPSLSATLIRMLVATGALWLITLVRGQVAETWQALKDREAVTSVIGGSLTGPFLGVWLSMVAVQRAHVGIASTLMAMSPIMLIPLTHLIFGERISPRSIAGTVVALAGATIIFLV